VETQLGNRLLVMVNHFKSKGFGSQQSSNAKRLSQAQRVKEIYKARIADGLEYIAVVGDLNDTPKSDPLKPLLQDTDLRDVSEVVGFDDKGFAGTFGSSTANKKIDYILLSPKLFAKLSWGGIFRLGMWAGSRPKKWETYEELKREEDAASDHGAVWADIDI
jgi:endonuclease/exonuclease/phosphatase family metal-dependent hydrolase